MKTSTILSTAVLFLFFFIIASVSSFGQTYTSLVQFHITPDGTEKYEFHQATIIFYNNNKNLKIFYNEHPKFPFIFTLEKFGVIELSDKTGTVTQYSTIEDSNFSYLNYNLVMVNDSHITKKLNEKYSYNFDVSIIQIKPDKSVEVMDKYLINR
jgi:hypothetical protein